MKLQDMMMRNVIQIAPAESIGTAAKRMSESAVGCLVVTVNDAVKGIITDRDLLGCLAQKHDPYRCEVSAHMRRPVIVLRPEEEAATAAEVMRNRRIKRLPVAKYGKLLGIVSLSDLAALASEEANKLGSSLDFFTGVVRAQSSQHNLPKDTASHKPPALPVPDSVDTNNRSEILDAGGPG
jgi:signal-transduction protein with cAMP-binding, CBS, and nucleotidyltransferase domain